MLNYERSLLTINGKHLMEKDVKPVKFIIDDLLSAGVHLLVGSPKIGKSWLSLWLCLSVANGTDVWGFKTHKGGVLYMTLEDNESRLQSRLKKLNMPVPDNIHFALTASDLDNGLLKQLEEFMLEYPDTSLIVIDTLQKIRGSMKEGTLYANDCKEMGLIREFADKYNIAVVLVHHAKKGFEPDPQDSISGTNGIAGSADINFVLKKHNRFDSVAVLSVSSRVCNSRELHLSFNDINCVWEKLTDSFEEKESERLSKMLRTFLEKEKSFVGTATELCERLREMFHEDFSANGLGKKLSTYQIVMKKYGVEYKNSRTHESRQISLSLNLPEEDTKEPDDADENTYNTDAFKSDLSDKSKLSLATNNSTQNEIKYHKVRPASEEENEDFVPEIFRINMNT